MNMYVDRRTSSVVPGSAWDVFPGVMNEEWCIGMVYRL